MNALLITNGMNRKYITKAYNIHCYIITGYSRNTVITVRIGMIAIDILADREERFEARKVS